MGRTLYLDCSSGISGDMLAGALLALGADERKLTGVLDSLPVEGFRINISRIEKQGIMCTDFDVVLDSEHDNHDHDMEYLHGHDADEPLAFDEKGNVKEGHVHGHHHHRTLDDIVKIIETSTAGQRAIDTAKKIFTILANAESKAHGIPVEAVHFHEVGAVDSIADIIAVAVCLDDLDIENAVVGEMLDGCGTVRTQHGILPVPVPAVKIIAEEYGLPLSSTDVKGEMVTPTGAATAAAIRTLKDPPETFTVLKEGCGAGKRKYKTRGFLKAFIIE